MSFPCGDDSPRVCAGRVPREPTRPSFRAQPHRTGIFHFGIMQFLFTDQGTREGREEGGRKQRKTKQQTDKKPGKAAQKTKGCMAAKPSRDDRVHEPIATSQPTSNQDRPDKSRQHSSCKVLLAKSAEHNQKPCTAQTANSEEL